LNAYNCDCVGRHHVSPQVTSLCKQVNQDPSCKLRASQVPLPARPIGQELARPSSKMSQDWQASKSLCQARVVTVQASVGNKITRLQAR